MKKLFLLACVSTLFSFQAIAELPHNYQAFSAKKKQSLLWSEIKKSRYKSLPDDPKGMPNLFKVMNPRFLAKAFSRVSDEMKSSYGFDGRKEYRTKVFHPRGSVAKIKWVPEASVPYTGVFKRGGIGLVRISSALGTDEEGMTPGAAIKILRDGKSSINSHMIHSLTANEEHCNPFGLSISHHIPEIKGVMSFIVPVFKLAIRVATGKKGDPTKMSIAHFAQDTEGQSKSPYRIALYGTEEAKTAGFSCHVDWRETLTNVPAGTKLYSVWEVTSQGKKVRHLGHIESTSDFINSRFGDEGLYFQHKAEL